MNMRSRRLSIHTRGGLGTVVSALAMTVGLGVTSALAEPQTIYRETFGYCTNSLGKEAAGEASWMGLVQGLPKEKVSNLKVFSYGSTDIGGAVNSNPNGLSQGYSFWFRPVYGLSVITSEFPFDVGLLKTTQAQISYKQRLSGIDAALQPNKTQLALLIDDYWYISQQSVAQVRVGVWEDAVVNPASLTYGVVPLVPGLGPVTPTEYNAPLPAAGTVRAFGIFMTEVNGRVRIDNFTIASTLPSGSKVVTAIQTPSGASCPATSPDRTGGGGPQPTPDPDDGDSTPDYGTPDPTPTPVPTVRPTAGPGDIGAQQIQYSFCPIKQQGTGRAVRISRATQKRLLKKIPETSLVNLRDRAIFAVLGQRSLPFGALVNVKVGDYNQQRGILTVSKRASAKPIKVRLRGSAQQAIARYLSAEGAPNKVTAPLFLSAATAVSPTRTQSAVCLSEIRKMARSRAKTAKVVIAGVSSSRRR